MRPSKCVRVRPRPEKLQTHVLDFPNTEKNATKLKNPTRNMHFFCSKKNKSTSYSQNNGCIKALVRVTQENRFYKHYAAK